MRTRSPFRFKLRAHLARLAFVFLIAGGLSARAFESPAQLSVAREEITRHVKFLASPELTGRGVDTPGIKLAKDYIAREFAAYGLVPGGDNGTYFQSFDATVGVAVKAPASLGLEGGKPLSLDQDWTPLGLSSSGMAQGEVVFAGYGITVKDYGYDDYAGIDVRGKIVLVLRYEPPPKDDKSPFRKHPDYSIHAALRAKANNARDHGAVGMILVDLHHSGDERNELISTRHSLWRGGNSVLAAQIRRRAIEEWLDAKGVSLTALKEKIDREERPASIHLPDAKATLQVNLAEVRQPTQNVVGILVGSDSRLKDENIVIGAHYDHIGFGHFGTRDTRNEGQIHPGADDNASGTAVLLDLAGRLSQMAPKPARTIIFAAFSGEEVGLLGSRHYVNYPSMRLSSTKAMLNLDMVGRLNGNRLTVFGARSAKEFNGFIMEEAANLGLQITESDGIGGSDHMPFYTKKIPSLHFFTGLHSDYHRPTDTWEKLNIDGMAKVSDLVLAAARRAANTREPLSFVNLPARPLARDGEASRSYGAYLGSIPDFSGNVDGVRLAGVTDGSPAALAGLREGDVIVRLADTKIQNLEDLTAALRSKRPGDEVEIVVLRTGNPVTVKATLRSRG